MPAIDDKVVAMSFESSKFESGVNKTISALDKLKAALHFDGKSFDSIDAASKKVDLSHIGRGIEDVKDKLGALRLVAISVLANIAQEAVSAGARFAKAFVFGPIMDGFKEYSTNLNAIQTILANTQASGATLKDVNAALADLNHYSDKTIYNFSEMAKNIGTFTAAGVDLKTSTEAIKGIANLAALSGSNSQQASTAMYQLSQAISAGRVGLQDWNSVVNAGMGGTVFQRALAETAVNMGTLKDNALKLVGPMKNVSINGESFRQSMQAGPGTTPWLTSKVLTETLRHFTGDLTDAQLAAKGFNEQQIKAIQQTAKTAQHAATEVKTISQVFDVAKETAGSGWAQTFQLIFGNFNEAKKTFTSMSETINGFINASANARNKVLGDWKALGGRVVLLDAIKVAFHNIMAILAPIKDAFRDIFPATTGKNLFDLTNRLHDFAEALKPSQDTVDGLRSTFRGLFAVLDIGKQIIGGIFTVFGQLFGAMGQGQGGFLKFTGSIGDFLVSVDEALKKGNRLHNFFVGLGNILAVPIRLLEALAKALANVFGGFSSGGISDQIDGMTKPMTNFQKVTAGVSKAWHEFIDSVKSGGATLKPALDGIVEAISSIGSAIANAFANMNFDQVMAVIRTGLFGALVVMLKQFLGKGSLLNQLSGGVLKNLSGSLGSLTGTLKAMQTNIKADTLQKIAIAIGILAASVLALSLVNPDRLTSSITALGFMFGELLAAMTILDKIGKSGGFIKMPFIAGSLILLAGAIDVLVLAVLGLSQLSWTELTKGLGGVAVLLGVISAAAVPLSANSAGMVRAGIGITAIAVAMKILASAVKDFGGMSWTEIGKGLAGIAGGLVIIVGAMTAMPKGMVVAGVGLIAVATGLKILASAVNDFGKMDWRAMGKGLLGVAGALVIIAGAMQLMPNMLLASAGLLLVSVALQGIAKAVGTMGGMSIKEIAKGLGTLAGSLAILAAALYLMSGAIGGAAALGIAAAGIALLAPALVLLGKQSWEGIIKSMVTLAAGLGLLAAAGLLLGPVVPVLLGLGAALVLLGAGLALAGAGIFLISSGLSALAVAGPAGVAILVSSLESLVAAIPEMVKNLVLGLLEIVKALADTAPQFVDALVKILNSLLDVIIQSSPKIAQAFDALMKLALQVLHDNVPKVIQAGMDLILSLINGIKNNIGPFVNAVVDVITRFLNTISGSLGKIIQAGADVLVSLLKGIANTIGTVTTSALSIITAFLNGIANNLGKIVAAGLSILTKLLSGIADHIGDVIKAGTDLVVAVVNGIERAGGRIITAAREAATSFMNTLVSQIVKFSNDVFNAMINLMNGLANVISARAPEMRAAAVNVGVAIIQGLTGGVTAEAQSLYNTISGVMSKALSLIHKIPLVKSPSKVTTDVGMYIVQGLIQGISNTAPALYSQVTDMSNGLINTFRDVLQIQSPSKVMVEIGKNVGRGFAEGLRGSGDDIRGAFRDMNDDLTKAMSDARATIETEQAKLNKLREANKPDQEAIKEAQKIIAENQDILARTTAGHIALVKTLQDEKAELIGLTGDYEKLGEKLKAAKEVLADAVKTRNDAVKGFTDKYSTLPDIVTQDAEQNSVDQLATYMEALKHEADAVAAYHLTLDQLRKLGLDDATYQKLLDEGTMDQAFANQLLAGGKTAVDALNVLDANLMKVSASLAVSAGKNLYQAGVDAANGLVKGLASQSKAIRNKMEDLADEMIKELKKHLDVRSPSREFAKIGVYAMQGLANGITTSTSEVTDALETAANDALTQMQRKMSDISGAVTAELDMNPVITPVLDLTQVRNQAGELVALTNMASVTGSSSYGQASIISSQQTAAQVDETVAAGGGSVVKFEQNNYSPTALSEIDIYRQTKNQLSQLKSVLAN